MSIQTVPTFELYRLPEQIASAPTYAGATTFDIVTTGINGFAAYIGQMPFTATIDSLFFRVNGSTGTFQLFPRLENVNVNQGVPNGILLHPNASAQVAVAAGAANYEVKFPGSFTISQGTIFSITIAASSGGPTPNVTFANFSDDNQGNSFPYCLDSSTVRDDIAPGFGIGLSAVSGVPLRFCWPMNVVPPAMTFRFPTMHGNKITINAPIRACGVTVWGDVGALSATINLFNSTGTTLASGIWYSALPNNATDNKFNILFDRPTTLTPGVYYIAVRAGDSTSNTQMYYASFASSFWRSASPMGGTDVVYVSSNTAAGSPPSWTEINTRQTFLGLLVDGIDDGIRETSSVFAA